MAQHHKRTIIVNMTRCTHLSTQILSSQSSLGNELPGIVSNTVEMVSQTIAGKKPGFRFFKELFFCNIERGPERGLLFNQLYNQNYYSNSILVYIRDRFAARLPFWGNILRLKGGFTHGLKLRQGGSSGITTLFDRNSKSIGLFSSIVDL